MAIQQDHQKILGRYATLSPSLRALLFSAQTAEIVRVACESNRLPLEKNPDVAKIVGLVFFGFIHPEDLAGELEGGASIPAQTAINIADSLNKKLFAPIKSDLEKIYAPLPHEHEIATGPKILQEIKPAAQVAPQAAAPQASAPKAPLSTAGWSKSTPENPVVKLSQTTPSIPQPVQKVAPVAPRPMPSEIKNSMGEFERIAAQQEGKNIPSAPPPSTPKPPAAPIPAPVIIHEDTVFKAAPQPSNFHLQLPAEQFGSRGPSAAPPKAAVLELGKATAPSAAPRPAPASTPRVVHYTEYKAPAQEPAPAAGATQATPVARVTPPPPQGPRQITEMTAPTPPAPPQNKVVYKDYAEPPKRAV